MTEFTKTELEKILIDTQEHLAETKRLGPGYYGIRERYDYAIEADERYIEKLKRQIAEYDQAALNKNQQIVLEWLKDRTTVSSITNALWLLLDDALEVDYDTDGSEAWNRLTIDQKFQVLAAFAEWGMKEVAE